MYLAFQNNVLPGIWRTVSYSSLKPLSSWFKDMISRVTFIREWLHNKAPLSYWMSGFYFPQGYLTGVLQTHARQYKIPIDTLSFKFKVLAIEKEKLTNAPEVRFFLFRMEYISTDYILMEDAGRQKMIPWSIRSWENCTSRCQSSTSCPLKTTHPNRQSTNVPAIRPPTEPVCSPPQVKAQTSFCRSISTPNRIQLTSGPSEARHYSASLMTDDLCNLLYYENIN